jgi:acyl carrier protein
VSDTMAQVTNIVSKFARNKEGLQHVTESTSFRNDLGISSASLIDIVLDLEDTFGMTIGDDELKQIDTVGAAVALIEAKQSSANGAN